MSNYFEDMIVFHFSVSLGFRFEDEVWIQSSTPGPVLSKNRDGNRAWKVGNRPFIEILDSVYWQCRPRRKSTFSISTPFVVEVLGLLD